MKKTFFAALVAIATLSGVGSLSMSLKKEHVLTAANVEALSRSEWGEVCGGCSTDNPGRYCCTVYMLGYTFDLYYLNH